MGGSDSAVGRVSQAGESVRKKGRGVPGEGGDLLNSEPQVNVWEHGRSRQ